MNSFTLREYMSVSDDKKMLEDSLRYHQVDIKEHEKNDFKEFLQLLSIELDEDKDLEGWFLGTDKLVVPDFDVLLYTNNFILNLDLKHENGIEKFSFISKKFASQSRIFRILKKRTLNVVFLADKKEIHVWCSSKNSFKKVSFQALADLLTQNEILQDNEIQNLSSSKFLISPTKNPDSFMNGEYWLTNNQQQIVEHINQPGIFGVHGEAGSGKTLLAYDFIRRIDGDKQVLFIFSGDLRNNHIEMSNKFSTVQFVAAKDCLSKNLDCYDIVLIDEAQRLYSDLRTKVSIWAKENYREKTVIFFFDTNQSLSCKDSGQLMLNLCQTFEKDNFGKVYGVEKNIRSNPYIGAFVRKFFDLSKNPPEIVTTENMRNSVSVRYFSNANEAIPWINNCIKKGFQFITTTGDSFHDASCDKFRTIKDSINTHQAIGDEFDNVITYIDESIGYDKTGKVKKKNGEYYYNDKETYVNMSRAKEKLCIAVVNNPDVYQAITECILM